ncbi:putative allantoicase [Actinocatenispora thailandica]|uniref:Probable allantoicase n=1 Tax=Actinocatenispora thailandica TaxID=227318 RepID=A0A7R7HWT6_9ACTN|nr:allantoicase [Actinocatenispora thailandica]BCJ34324.1 putative allantoicase [Actinocatenispora thailandica]
MLDLASVAVRGTVIAANDEFFAGKENLIEPAAPSFAARTFGPHGQIYDGWETRRRRSPGADWAVVRLGAPGVVRRVVVDTAHFTGNFPERCAVEATAAEGYPGVDELTDWTTLVPVRSLRGDTAHEFAVTDEHRYTHVRLRIFPDGGVARLRVFGAPLPDPRDLAGCPAELTGAALGGYVADRSDSFFAPADNLLLPDPAAVMGDGFETRRRRADGNDWVELALGIPGVPHLAEIDARHFLGNAPGAVRLTGQAADGTPIREVLPETGLQPGTCHRFRLAAGEPVHRVRLDLVPDGGLARFRLYGSPTTAALDELALRYANALPEPHARVVLGAAAAERPYRALPDPVRAALLGAGAG